MATSSVCVLDSDMFGGKEKAGKEKTYKHMMRNLINVHQMSL